MGPRDQVINVCLQSVVTAQCYHLDLDTLSVTSIIFMDTTLTTLFSITHSDLTRLQHDLHGAGCLEILFQTVDTMSVYSFIKVNDKP